MPKHRKPHPSRRGPPASGGATPYSYTFYVPETPVRSSTDSTGREDPFADLPDDGCSYIDITPNAKFEGKDVLFPDGVEKMYPPRSSASLTKIFEASLLPPGQGGMKWTTLPYWKKGEYFDELRKEFFLPNKLLRELWHVFNRLGSYQYKHLINDLKMKRVKPDNIDVDEWQQWLAYWDNKNTDDVASKNSDNRRTIPKDGTVVSMHSLGSRSSFSGREQTLLLQLQEKNEEVKRLVAEQAAQKAKYNTMFAELYAKLGMKPPTSL